MLLFKYLSPSGAVKVLEREDRLAVKFGLPRTYNDPYELFLQPAPPLQTDHERAFYDFFLGQVVQAPVTCFSRRPESVVMWAHYGREGAGLCLGFDEDELAKEFTVAFFENVVYSDVPATVDSHLVTRALVTGKRRHALWLLASAHRSAYFVKRTDWQYEAERRLVVPTDAVADREGVLIADVSPRSLRYIILGTNAAAEVRELAAQRATAYGVPILEFRVGRRTYSPFFVAAGETTEWSGSCFSPLDDVCEECGEPVALVDGCHCEWCAIDEEARQAPNRSLLVASLHYGIDQGLPLVFEGLMPKGRLVGEEPE